MSVEMITGPCVECGQPASREALAGFGARLNSLPLTCEGCRARGDAEREAEEQRLELAQLDRRHGERIARSGLPHDRRDRGLSHLDRDGRTGALALAQKWVAGDIRGLLLTGSVGTGKTTIAAAALHDRARRQEVRWTSATGYLSGLSAPFGSAERTRAEALRNPERSSRAPAPLAVDDLDKVRGTEHAAEAIFALVDSCESHGRPLIVTTNLRLGELGEKWPAPYGASIASRLAGYCEAYVLDGRDRRLDRERG